jgi:hypothetical protein
MPLELMVPPAIDALVQQFDHSEAPFTERDVSQALGKARGSLEHLTEAENYGAWADVLGLVEASQDGVPPAAGGNQFAPLMA